MNFRFIKVVIIEVFMFIKLIPTYIRFKNNKNNISQEEIYSVVRNHAKNTLKIMGVEFSVNSYAVSVHARHWPSAFPSADRNARKPPVPTVSARQTDTSFLCPEMLRSKLLALVSPRS